MDALQIQWDDWLRAKTVAGVHVRWITAQQCSYTLCVLEQRKHMVSVCNKQANISSLEELLSYLTPPVPGIPDH